MKPDPDELVTFLSLLTEDAPDGYTPWLFRVESGSKAPALKYGSWKDEKARLEPQEAVEWMKTGGNVGIAGRPDDALINVDIDDEDETTIDDLKPTLIARSRSRTGVHAWYFEAPGADIPNIPTDDAGEVRANWQYVVAPGSYVETDKEQVPEAERDNAGYYTVERDDPVTSLRLNELPEVFRSQQQPDPDQQEILAPDAETPEAETDGASALYGIDAADVVRKEGGGSTDAGDRWSSLFHGSDTGHNMSLSDDELLHCWRHEVAHNGLQALAVLSGYRGVCADVGTGHKRSGAGQSCLHREDGAHIWHAWKYAKTNGYIPDDDPVPYAALKHLCRERELCPVSEIPSEYDEENEDGRLPEYAYNGAIESIRGHDELEPGRKTTDDLAGAASSLDVVEEDEPAEGKSDNGTEGAASGETDGGVAVETSDTSTTRRSFNDAIRDIVVAADNEDIQAKTARHRIAETFLDYFDFVHPEQEVRGWRSILYVYNDDAGIYEPRGEAFIKRKLDVAAGDYVTNQVTNEIIGKIRRRSIERGAAFEREPERLAVANGIVDLHDGTLTDFSPAEYHRTKLDVAWRPGAGEPEAIDEFLHEIVEPSDVTTLYRLIAHTVYKEYIGEKAAILIGSGQNGKSVFLDLIQRFLGSHNVAHRELQDFDDDLYAANNLEGKLANLATEIGEQQLNDTTTFKKLTGRDTMDAPVKFEKPLTFENYASLMFATNEMPVFGQDNHAIWRRWVYVDFPHTFDETDPTAKDPEPKHVLMDRLTDERELEALLVRCQQEIARWHDDPSESFFADAMPPTEVRDKMKKAAEPVYNFASTCLEVGDEDETEVEKSVVRAAYRAYADAEDLPAVAENEFGKRLLSLRDFPIEATQRRINGTPKAVYAGIELSARGRQVLGVDEPDDDAQTGVDDERPQASAILMTELREMVEQNDGEPVPRNGLVWRVAGDVGKATAEKALDELKKNGRVLDGGDGVLPTE